MVTVSTRPGGGLKRCHLGHLLCFHSKYTLCQQGSPANSPAVSVPNSPDLDRTAAAEFAQKLAAVEVEKAELNKTITELNKTITELNKTNTEIKAKQTEADKTNSELNKTNSEANKTISKLRKTNSELDADRTELNKTITEANKTITEANKTNSEANKTNSELNKTNSELNKTNSELNKTYRASAHQDDIYVSKALVVVGAMNAELKQKLAEADAALGDINYGQMELAQEKEELAVEQKQLADAQEELAFDREDLDWFANSGGGAPSESDSCEYGRMCARFEAADC